MIALVALALVGGAVAIGNHQSPDTNNQENLAAVISARDKSPLVDIERQLANAQKSGGISPTSYRSIESKLKALEKKKIDTKKARALLKKLSVGGKNPPSPTFDFPKSKVGDTSFSKGGTQSPPLKKGAEEAREKKAAGVKGYWQQWETEYKPVGTIPLCPDPFVIPSPADVSKVTSILYPGQVRGEYKAHGGFRFDNQTNNEVTVRIPLDAEFVYGSRHYQSGEIQYLLGFRMPCGIEYRLDHLLTLSPKFQGLVDKHLPPPKYDSFTTEVKPPVSVKAGEIVATEVGFRNTRNIGFDFGVYDLRKKNKKASDPAWVAARKGNSLAPYAICWLDYLSPSEQQTVKGLPGADWKMGKTSDFCTDIGIVTQTPAPSAELGAYRAGIDTDFAAVKGEIENAERTGGRFSKEHSERVFRDLDSLEKTGVAESEIERLRAVVRRHSPHLADEKRAAEEARKTAAANTPCADPPPTLTADITDFAKIRMITAPGSGSSEGPKGHSFIWTDGARVPVYAPVAGVYDSGSLSKDHPTPESKAQYLLFFRVKGSCGYQFKFDHIDEPVESIRSQLLSEPKISDSRGTPATNPVEFNAGELIGYTSGNIPSGNWDFGLYNMNKEGALKAHGCSATHCNSVCWPDFYAVGKREAYRKLLDGPKLVCGF